ncbi:MAG: hypothetical protein DRI65_17710 [Chloroflexota bacterium]|nr:MAG: hypothetical protein DRI65_17710 [Chloroflexota bacterium]
MLERLSKMAANRRLNQAKKFASDGLAVSEYNKDMISWITPELLDEHDIFPFKMQPNGFRTYVMNLRPVDRDIDFWSLGKQVQSKVSHGQIEYECVAEVMAGYWEFLRFEVHGKTWLTPDI